MKSYYPLFPNYPRHEHHYSVALVKYCLTVKRFISTMIDEGYYVVRPGLPTFSDEEI